MYFGLADAVVNQTGFFIALFILFTMIFFQVLTRIGFFSKDQNRGLSKLVSVIIALFAIYGIWRWDQTGSLGGGVGEFFRAIADFFVGIFPFLSGLFYLISDFFGALGFLGFFFLALLLIFLGKIGLAFWRFLKINLGLGRD